MTPLIFLCQRNESLSVTAGSGISLRSAGNKILVGVRQKNSGYSGAWAVTGSVNQDGLSVKVNKGLVNGIEPVIGEDPIGGVLPDGTLCENGQPVLKGSVNGRVYVCLKITPDKNGRIEYNEKEVKLGKESSLTVEVVSAFLGRGNGGEGESSKSWYHPLAIFDQCGLVAQLAYFDYFYKAYKKRDLPWCHHLTVA